MPLPRAGPPAHGDSWRRRGEASSKFPAARRKSQVTVEYRGGRRTGAGVVIAAQHEDSVSTEHFARRSTRNDRQGGSGGAALGGDERMINATGRSHRRPMGDSGVTGRRSSSIPTAAWATTAAARSPGRIPRSGSQRGLCCALGSEEHRSGGSRQTLRRCRWRTPSAWPSGLHHVETFGTHAVPEEKIEKALRATFSLSRVDHPRLGPPPPI